MSALGNIIWIIFGGFVAALYYLVGGVVLCLTIIGIPFGLKCFQLAAAVLTPFGRRVVKHPNATGCVATVFNIVWVVAIGWQIALVHLFFGVILAVTVVGLPFAQQHFKLAAIAFLPFSYDLQ